MVILNGDGFHEDVFSRIFRTFLMSILNNSFTAHLELSFFLFRCILLTGLCLIQACTSPLIRTLRFDSPDWQLQCQDTGGTVKWICLSGCLFVGLFVCSLLRYRINVFLPPLPKVGCPKFLELRNPWGKVMEKSGLTFYNFR